MKNGDKHPDGNAGDNIKHKDERTGGACGGVFKMGKTVELTEVDRTYIRENCVDMATGLFVEIPLNGRVQTGKAIINIADSLYNYIITGDIPSEPDQEKE